MDENNLSNQLDFQINVSNCIKIFNHMNNGILITNKHSSIFYVNPAFSKITGYSREESIGRNPGMLHSGRHDVQFYKEMWNSIEGNGFWEGEIWNRRKSGEIYAELLTISTITSKSTPENFFYIAAFSDISFLKKGTDRNMHLAFYDPLTELPNRNSYLEQVNRVFSTVMNNPKKMIAVMYMDLNKFKQVNDTYGHCAGDDLLKMVGERLSATTRTTDFIARIGGDEFTAIISGDANRLSVSKFAERIIESIEKPFLIQGHDIQISISIGISFFPKNANTIDELLSKADKAMYQAKKSGVRLVYYDENNQPD